MKKGKKLTLGLAIGSLSILLTHVINQIIFIISTMKEVLFSENSSYYNWRFGKIFYTKKGTGTPVLLIHDLDCTSSDYEWKGIINMLSHSHTVYTLDLLGCGRSDKPKMTYTNFLYVQLISDFIKNVIKHKTDVIVTGHTSPVIIMSCYMDRNLFQDIILVNPDPLTAVNKYPKTKHKILKFILGFPILGTFMYNIALSKSFIKDSFYNKYYAKPSYVKNRYISAYYEAAHKSGSASKYMYSSIKCHYTNTNFIHAFKELNNSIYIIGGEFEENIDDILEQYTELNPSIETAIIKNTRHLPHLENPEGFVNTIDIYLNR